MFAFGAAVDYGRGCSLVYTIHQSDFAVYALVGPP